MDMSITMSSSRTSPPRTTSTRHQLSLSIPLFLLLLVLPSPLLALNQDGVLLLSFKFTLLADPFGYLAGWSYADDTPCSWNGVVCMAVPATADDNTNLIGSSDNVSSSALLLPLESRVVSLILPNAQLVGPVAAQLGLIEHLRQLDLSGNALNGTLPNEIFEATELRVLSLAGNAIAGELPEIVGQLRSLRALNLASNALTGRIPGNLTVLPNLTAVSLAGNHLSGVLPGGGLGSIQVFDVSSNLLNGSLPPDFGGNELRYVNLSSNRLVGDIPAELASQLPANLTIDLSYNNLTGAIPASGPFVSQRPAAFAGNPDLCGPPLRNLCAVPSTFSNPPNGSGVSPAVSDSPPAIAAIPENPNAGSSIGPAGNGGGASGRQGGMRLVTIVAIAAGDLAGIGILLVVFLYVYQVKKRRQRQQQQQEEEAKKESREVVIRKGAPPPESPPDTGRGLACCLRKKGGGDDTEEASETEDSSATEGDMKSRSKNKGPAEEAAQGRHQAKRSQDGAVLVTLDDDAELELETLLKASAYILGAAGSSIVYKAVLANGTVLAVRRIGRESGGIGKFKDFEAQVRAIAKIRHANLLRLRGFYWGADERLLIHDYAVNGSLANVSFRRRPGFSPLHLGWDARLRIVRGVARGLAYVHEKKCVHGNVKPSNILLGSNLEPLLGDFGLDRLVPCEDRPKPGMSAWQFGSKRSAKSLPDLSPPAGVSSFGPSSSCASGAQYRAPEFLRGFKPNAKWDVYSFGMVLLELVTSRTFSEVELCQWTAGFNAEEKSEVLRMADPALRGELEGKEESVVSCFKIGFSCCAMTPQKRPSMKDALQALERIPSH